MNIFRNSVRSEKKIDATMNTTKKQKGAFLMQMLRARRIPIPMILFQKARWKLV